ncbi:zinc finger protein 761-like [Leptidea sinapis]|uniref:zinc finger protein 761-like n=1 Tax=Leptidea sinapis TaxID=189913 RepID=UPI0021C2AA4A|nr:zinc finger protein 761-like [Leptidea sinapis]
MNSDDYVYAMFKCDKCIVPFSSKDDLDEHFKLKHKIVSITCCLSYITSLCIPPHLSLRDSKYNCVICERGFSRDLAYRYHMNRHRLRFQCVMCEVLLGTKREVMLHSREHGNKLTESPMFPCPKCSKLFRWKTSLRKHLEQHQIEDGERRKPYCEACGLYFTSARSLKKHQDSSKHKIQLNTDSDDIKMISTVVNETQKTYPCTLCDKKFQWKGNLVRHVQSHKAKLNGDLVCAPCNRTFSSIATYQQHMKSSLKHVSQNDLKFVCTDCGKRFASNSKLRDHSDYEHRKIYSNTCTVCDKVFKCRASLFLHKQVVHQKKEFLCDHCGKYFPNKTKLGHHIRATHTRDGSYVCGTCDAKFAWASCLSRHKRTQKHA